MKILLNFVGISAVMLALLGVFLPLLPTTPFLLLASACFFRSSPRLHSKLIGSPVLGPYLLSYQEGNGIPLKVKVVAISLLWVSLFYSISQIEPPIVQIMLAAMGIGVTAYLLKIKTSEETTGK